MSGFLAWWREWHVLGPWLLAGSCAFGWWQARRILELVRANHAYELAHRDRLVWRLWRAMDKAGLRTDPPPFPDPSAPADGGKQ